MAIRRHVEEVRTAPHSNRRDYFILLSVDHADVRRCRVDDVNFVTFGIRSSAGRFRADGKSADRRKRSQVDYGNVVALAVRDVGKFTIKRSIGGKGALVEVIPSS